MARGITQLTSGLLTGSHCSVPSSPLFIIAARHFSAWSASSSIPSLPLNLATGADSSTGTAGSKAGAWIRESVESGTNHGFGLTTRFHMGSAFDNVSPILKEQAFQGGFLLKICLMADCGDTAIANKHRIPSRGGCYQMDNKARTTRQHELGRSCWGSDSQLPAATCGAFDHILIWNALKEVLCLFSGSKSH
jgi:hypothetical protein